MNNLYVFKGSRAKELMEFLNKSWGLHGLNKLLKKLQETGAMVRDEVETLKRTESLLFFYSENGDA